MSELCLFHTFAFRNRKVKGALAIFAFCQINALFASADNHLRETWLININGANKRITAMCADKCASKNKHLRK